MELQLMTIRKTAGYKSRSEIAVKLGVSERKYKSWETGEVKLTLKGACDIADLLRCTLDELAGRHVSPAAYADHGQQRMNDAFERMNADGCADAADAVEKLTFIPAYTDRAEGRGNAETCSA